MNDAEAVDLGERLAGLEDVVDRILDGDLFAGLDHRVEVAAVEILHDHVGGAVGHRSDVGDARDVLALEPRGGARLAKKALRHSGQLADLRATRP